MIAPQSHPNQAQRGATMGDHAEQPEPTTEGGRPIATQTKHRGGADRELHRAMRTNHRGGEGHHGGYSDGYFLRVFVAVPSSFSFGPRGLRVWAGAPSSEFAPPFSTRTKHKKLLCD